MSGLFGLLRRAAVAAAAGAVLLCACRGRDVVAVVGRTELHRQDLEVAARAAPRGRIDASGRATLEVLVERALLAEAARRDGLANDLAVKARIEAARREILAQAYLDRELAPVTRDDALRSRYAAKKHELTAKKIHVRQMAFVSSDAGHGDHDAARARAVRAYARLVGGEPFEKVAREVSEDRVSGARGGDVGPLLEGEVEPTFFAAAAALKKGEISRPFETPFGFHVAQAIEDPVEATPAFEEVRGRLAADARREAQIALDARLRKEIDVEIHPKALIASGGAGRRD